MEEEDLGSKAGFLTKTDKKNKKSRSKKKAKPASKKVTVVESKLGNVGKLSAENKSPAKKIDSGDNKVGAGENMLERDAPAKEEEEKANKMERKTPSPGENVEISKALGTKGKKRTREDKKMAEEFKSSGGCSLRLRPRKQVPSFRKICLREENYSRVVGKRIKVFWPDEKKWFVGRVTSFDNGKKVHGILYDDGDKETLELKAERFQLEVLPNEVFGEDLAEESGASSKEHASVAIMENKEIGSPKLKKQKKEMAPTDMEIDGKTQKDGKEKLGMEEDVKPEKKREKTLKQVLKLAKRGNSKNQGSKAIAKGKVGNKAVDLEVGKLPSKEGSKGSIEKCYNLEKPAMNVDDSGGQPENSNGGKQTDETNSLIKNRSESHEISNDTKAKHETENHSQEEKPAVSDAKTPEINNDEPVKDETEDNELGGKRTSKGAGDQKKKDEGQVASHKALDKKVRAKSKTKK